MDLDRRDLSGRVGPVRLRELTPSPAAEALWRILVDALRADLCFGAETDE